MLPRFAWPTVLQSSLGSLDHGMVAVIVLNYLMDHAAKILDAYSSMRLGGRPSSSEEVWNPRKSLTHLKAERQSYGASTLSCASRRLCVDCDSERVVPAPLLLDNSQDLVNRAAATD